MPAAKWQFVLRLMLLGLCCSAGAALAQWSNDPAVNLALCTEAQNQNLPVTVPDGTGGVIVVWEDGRNATFDIYAQRVSSTGAPEWALNGIPVCAEAHADQFQPEVVSDGAGGVIVGWIDMRNGNPDLYAQRLSAAGATLWAVDGVPVCTTPDGQADPSLAPDGVGGVLVAWEEARGSNKSDNWIYAQRVNATGVIQWPLDGVALCTAAVGRFHPRVATDGTGGAIVSWTDARRGRGVEDMYAQRVSAGGSAQWTPDGIRLSNPAHSGANFPVILPDQNGGAILTWTGDNVGEGNIYAQRVNSAGATQWAVGDVLVCTATGDQTQPTVVPDGLGGAIIAWLDTRSSTAFRHGVYAQRVSAAGLPQWTPNGVPVSPSHVFGVPQSASDGAGGAILTWTTGDIFAQRVNAAGALVWATEGLPICTAPNDQDEQVIVPDGIGGAVIAWSDMRNGPRDIYAQNVTANGTLGDLPTPVLGSLVRADVVADHVVIRWHDPHPDAANVYRSTSARSWERVARVSPDGTDIVRYEDASVVPGTRYGYRLGVPVDGREIPVGEVWVDVPLHIAFALESVRPNPSAADVSVTFSLKDDSAAKIDVLDVAGRKVLSVRLDQMGSGTHVMSLGSSGRALPAGIYTLRLQQASRLATRRFAIVR